MDLCDLWETFPAESLESFSSPFLQKQEKTHTYTHREEKHGLTKLAYLQESTVNSICTTGHSRGSFLSTLCSPVIRSFLWLTVRWRDGLLAGRTQGPIHSKPQSQSTSGIQKNRKLRTLKHGKVQKKSLRLEMNY